MSHLKMTAWGLEKMMVRVQAVTTIILALLLCAAQLRDSSGDWMVISLTEIRHCFRYFCCQLFNKSNMFATSLSGLLLTKHFSALYSLLLFFI